MDEESKGENEGPKNEIKFESSKVSLLQSKTHF